MLVEGDHSAEDVEVVIGAVKSNQAYNKAAEELEAALGIKAKLIHNPASSPRYRQRPLSMASSSAADTWP